VNRTSFRGVTAACVSGAVIATAGIVGTALAAGPGGTARHPVVLTDGLAPHVPIRPVPRRAARPVRPAPARASRTVRRTALVGSPRTIAHALLLRRGWSETQWSCLDTLWTRESQWRVSASNYRSGAYGIPQALPATKMASMGSDWRTNPITQIRWGLWYIGASYGDPCNALAHSNHYGYY
jgi:hypothetical protein